MRRGLYGQAKRILRRDREEESGFVPSSAGRLAHACRLFYFLKNNAITGEP